jgi:hypothetical protein
MVVLMLTVVCASCALFFGEVGYALTFAFSTAQIAHLLHRHAPNLTFSPNLCAQSQ